MPLRLGKKACVLLRTRIGNVAPYKWLSGHCHQSENVGRSPADFEVLTVRQRDLPQASILAAALARIVELGATLAMRGDERLPVRAAFYPAGSLLPVAGQPLIDEVHRPKCNRIDAIHLSTGS